MMCFILRGLKIMSEPSVDEEANAAHLLPSDVPYVHYGTGTVRMRTGTIVASVKLETTPSTIIFRFIARNTMYSVQWLEYLMRRLSASFTNSSHELCVSRPTLGNNGLIFRFTFSIPFLHFIHCLLPFKVIARISLQPS